MKHHNGFTLPEVLVVIAILGVLAGAALAQPGRDRERLQLTAALRRLQVGLDRGRMAAERSGQPCGLSLTVQGWQPSSGDGLPPCPAAATSLQELDHSAPALHSNLPPTVRFTANGLVLDGGVVVLSHQRLPDRRCLVIGLPLGIIRTGRYGADPQISLSSRHCRPDAHA